MVATEREEAAEEHVASPSREVGAAAAALVDGGDNKWRVLVTTNDEFLGAGATVLPSAVAAGRRCSLPLGCDWCCCWCCVDPAKSRSDWWCWASLL